MLNKLKFNNLVISNKKGIQQSRIQTINKLVHKIRKLKTLLEKHTDNSKFKERIRKSKETMEILKKLKRADVMKKVLLMDKPAAAVITNGLATPDEIAVALLSINKVMLGLIKIFKTELQLNEVANDDWKQVLMESSKRKLKIERTEGKRRKRLESKLQKSMGRKRQEWLQNNQQTIGENISFKNDLNVSTTAGWLIEELPNDKNTNDTSEEAKNPSVKESELPTKEKPITNRTSLSNKKQKVSKREQSKKIENKIKIEENDNESNSAEDLHKTESHNDIEDTAESLVVDPFFITDNGDNYLSTAVIKRDNTAEEKNNQEKRDLHMIKLNNYDKESSDFRRARNHSRRDKNPNNTVVQNSQDKFKSKVEHENRWNGKEESKRKKIFENKTYSKNNRMRQDSHHRTEQNLHPSWAAKQMLKPVITEFQGKKITFEDNDFSKSKRNQEKEIKTSHKSITAKVNCPADSLHPSWVAKQKLKPSITAFQGKKITFDNDE